jgi:hypothetical protein
MESVGGSPEGVKNWKKLKQHMAVSSKISNRISSENFIGEDLKFSEDSLEGRVAATLQLGISHIASSAAAPAPRRSDQLSSTPREKGTSPIFRSPVGSTSLEDPIQMETIINRPLDDQHHGLSFTVNGEVCEFIEYYPEIFSLIRGSLGIDLIEYKAVLGLNVQTTFSELSRDISSSPLKSFTELDKKLKGAIDRTETVFKNLSKRRSVEPPVSSPQRKSDSEASSLPLPPSSAHAEGEDGEASATNGQSKKSISSAFSGVSSKLRTAMDQAKHSIKRQQQSSSSTSGAPAPPSLSTPEEVILRTNSSDSMIRSTLRFIGTKDASGKSASWFLFSPDMRYCCKTAKPAEAELLIKILPSYAMYGGLSDRLSSSHTFADTVNLSPTPFFLISMDSIRCG